MRFLLAILLLLTPFAGRTATIPAASTSSSAVQAAINTAVSGDTVTVPSGSATWSTAVSISGKSITLQGAGIGSTVITDATSGGPLKIFITAGITNRTTGFTFVAGSSHGSAGLIEVIGTHMLHTSFRIDHCRLLHPSAVTRGILPVGVYGLIDHNTFDVTATGGSQQVISPHGSSAGSDGGFTPWTRPLSLGTTNAVVIEDNAFNYTTSIAGLEDCVDAYGGARVVIRYNSFLNSSVGFHGTDSGNERSAVSFEVYSNSFVNNSSASLRAGTVRGGTGVWYGNSYGGSGTAYGGVNLMYYRAKGPSSGLVISGWGIVGSGNYKLNSANPSDGGSRVCSTSGSVGYNTIDKETLGTFGGSFQRYFDGSGTGNYPGRDQPGIAPGQIVTPIYVWNNGTHTAGPYNGGEEENSFGLANYIRPGEIYVNNGSTAKPGYTALVYPHPLIGGGGGGDTTPPVITITTPTSGSSYDNGASSSLAMAGTSSDNVAVSSVTASSDRGGSWSVTGTTSWSFTATGLSAGHNIITVTATDSSGNTSSDSLDVNYVPTSGNVYYVKPGGNNGNNGTSASTPWQTLQVSQSRTSAGDTLYVITTNGPYLDPDVLDIVNYASNALPTRFIAWPLGTRATIRGPGTNTSAPSVFNSTNVWVEGLNFDNFNIGMYVYGGSGWITFTNCDIGTIGQQGFQVKDTCQFVLFTDGSIHDTGKWAGHNGEGVYLGNGVVGGEPTHNCTFRRVSIYNCKDEFVEFKQGGYSNLLEYCVIDGSGSTANIDPEGIVEIDEGGTYGASADPKNIVRNNLIYNFSGYAAGIRAMTGCSIYNNVLYGGGSKPAIQAFEDVADTWTRNIWNNTIDASQALGIVVTSTQTSITNNIGSTNASNLAFNSAYFINAAGRNYNLAVGTAPVDSGLTISTVTTDLLGVTRPQGSSYDMGAYEFIPVGGPAPAVENLRVLGRSAMSGRVRN